MILRHLKATYLEGLPERPPAKVQQKRVDKQPQPPPPPLVPEVAEVEKKTYLVTVHDMKLLDMHKNKRNKVFPLYSAVRISMFGFEFSSGRCGTYSSYPYDGSIVIGSFSRQCQFKSTTEFAEAFQCEIDTDLFAAGSLVTMR